MSFPSSISGNIPVGALERYCGPAMASPNTSSPDWSNLPADVLVSFLERLPVVDHLHFGAVCASWRSAAARCPGLPKPPSPWLLLRSRDRIVGNDEACAFLAFPDGNKYSIRLPNVRYRYCIGSSNGWLVVVGDDGELCLLNPISGAVFALPRFAPNPDEAGGSWFSWKAAVSSGAPPSMGGFTVAMIQKHSDKLAVAGDGDHSWTVLEVPDRRLVDVAFHNGRVFVLADDGTAVVCDLAGGTSPLPAVTCAVSLSLEVGVLRRDAVVGNYYLVGSSTGGLLMMLRRSWRARMCVIEKRYQTERIEAFVLDDGREKWRKVENLGGTALFVGDNFSSFCVKGSPEFGRNCIYVSNLGLTHSVGVFDMDSGKMDICRHVNNEGRIWWEWSTIWFMPSLL